MKFNSKETYLAARQEWTLNYMDLSKAIRVAKGEFVEAQRAASKTSFDSSAGYTADSNKAYLAAYAKLNDARRSRSDLRTQANEALSDLMSAKEEAHRQWLLAHQT